MVRSRARSWVLLASTLALACRSGETSPTPASVPTEASVSEADKPPAEEPPAAASLPPVPDHPILDDTIRAARTRAQSEVLSGKEEPQPDLQPLPDGPLPGLDLPAEPLPGFFTKLEMPPEGDPLARFEAGLAELEAGERTEPVRVAVYGASGTAIDLWTAYVRRYLQARFGDGGPGIVSAAKHNKWYRHHELSIDSSKHWTKHNAYRRNGEDDPGYYGPIGVCHDTASKRAWAEIGKARRAPDDRAIAFYEVLHLQQPGGGHYRLALGGKEVAKVDTACPDSDRPHLSTHRIEIDAGHPKLRIEAVGDAPIRMLGVVAETGKPGVVLDTLAFDGAKITNQLVWDEPVWADGIKRRDPALVVMAFGTNASVREEENPLPEWEQGFRTVLERFQKTLPDAGCVILGPGDYPIVEGDQILPRPRLAEIRAIERRLAPEYGCAYWDALKFVGGEGAKKAWVEAGLARDDYLHLTRAGYVRLGIAFADALLQRYDWRRSQENKPG